MNRKPMTLDEQKQVMLNILKEFASFCDRSNLSYYLDAGTLIGAVRHKGYIPWDDDIDVNMPQKDYDRFIELTKKNNGYLSDHLLVEYPEDTVYTFLKISDERTILVEFPDTNPMEVGVYMDIFPKYGVKDKSWKSKLLCKISEKLALLHWFNKYSVNAWQRPGNSSIKKIIAKIAKALTWNDAWATKLQNKMMHRYAKNHPLEECSYVTTLTYGEFHKMAPKECFDGYQMLDFEGCQFKGPKDYDTYLHCLYKGDYMQLPPEDKREVHITEVYWK